MNERWPWDVSPISHGPGGRFRAQAWCWGSGVLLREVLGAPEGDSAEAKTASFGPGPRQGWASTQGCLVPSPGAASLPVLIRCQGSPLLGPSLSALMMPSSLGGQVPALGVTTPKNIACPQ